LVWRTLFYHRTRTNVGVILNYDITVALDARSKSDEIAHHAVMLHIAVQVGMKVPTDANIAGQCYERAQNGPLAQCYSIHLHDVGCLDSQGQYTCCADFLGQFFADSAIGNGQHRMALGGRRC